MSNVLIDGPESAKYTFIFAHGAGAGMEHEFMADVAAKIAAEGIRVVRFNFPYMVKRAEDGKKRPPDRAPMLLEAFGDIIAQYGGDSTVIGGKSMGGAWRATWGIVTVCRQWFVWGFLSTRRVNRKKIKVNIWRRWRFPPSFFKVNVTPSVTAQSWQDTPCQIR